VLLGLWYRAQAACVQAQVLLAADGQDPREAAGVLAEQLGHVVAGAAATAEEVVGGSYPRGPASLREHAAVLADVLAVHPRGSGAELARIAELVRGRAAVRPDEGFTGAVAAPVSASGETGLR